MPGLKCMEIINWTERPVPYNLYHAMMRRLHHRPYLYLLTNSREEKGYGRDIG